MLLYGDAVVPFEHRADAGVFDIANPATLSQGFFVHFRPVPLLTLRGPFVLFLRSTARRYFSSLLTWGDVLCAGK